MIHPLFGLCASLSLALGSSVFARTQESTSTIPSDCPRKRKRDEEAESSSRDEFSDKKPRMTESTSADEVEAYLLDTTLVDEDYDQGANKAGKPIATTLIQTPTKSSDTQADAVSRSRGPASGLLSPHAIAISAISPSRRTRRSDEEPEDASNARHEWELRWFVAAHHAAFTAATTMSLRREIRRRKTLTKMWIEIRKENIALREHIKKLSVELQGFVGT